MAAQDNGGDVQIFQRILQYAHQTIVILKNHIGDIAMNEKLTRVCAGQYLGRDTAVGTAYPQRQRLLTGNMLAEVMRVALALL